MKYLILIFMFISLSIQAGWQVAPNGDAIDRPLSWISSDPSIPERAPIGYPCLGKVAKAIGTGTGAGTRAWVYIIDGYDLAAVCEWVDPSPPVEPSTATLSHKYDPATLAANIVSIGSYVSTDGVTWNKTVVGLTGCTKYVIDTAKTYQYKETYIDDQGKESDFSQVKTIILGSGMPDC